MVDVSSGQEQTSGAMDDGALLEFKLVGDIAGSFSVPRYQRGYRWGRDEVESLLNDIWQNGDKDYSLQPIVVKRNVEGEWELVDGQQRLTTLYLIFVYMQRAGLKNVGPQYTLSYDTRPSSQAYLQAPEATLKNTNIDFFHIHAAYEIVQNWFEQKGPTPLKLQEVADDVFRYLCKRVRVIWYEAPKQLDSTTLFTRLNVGRIPLTDAELFKALLLSRIRDTPGTADRTHEIAAQWDAIERDLRQPDVWGFVADGDAFNSPTRITLLLDTIAGGDRGRMRPRFQTFEILRKRVEQSSPMDVWNEVVDLHALVLGWFENRDHFHKIGYLVTIDQPFSEIVDLAKGRAKSEFDAELDNRIRRRLKLEPSEVMELSYDKETDRDKFERLLLLMNVEAVRRVANSSERYPFMLHRKEDWSLEHIHAQHAEALTRVEQWKAWLDEHKNALRGLPTLEEERRGALLADVNDVLAKLESGGEQLRQAFGKVARDVTAAFTSSTQVATATGHSVHSVTNLALLPSRANSLLNNAVFEVKRRRIIDLDRQGSYIPVCTRQVFLKYYTDADAQQIHFWSARDREAYLNAILSTDGGVGRYLSPETQTP